MNKPARMAFILISFPKGTRAYSEIVDLINKFNSSLLGSIHVPERDSEIFGLLIKADTDQIGAITGSLGGVKGITVKSAILPQK